MSRHNAKAIRRRSGWFLWLAACPCGWRSEASGREDAAALAKRHNTEKAAADEHGPDPSTWFTPGQWPTCQCGYAPRDNRLLNAHWREHGFTVVDDHGHLVTRPVS